MHTNLYTYLYHEFAFPHPPQLSSHLRPGVKFRPYSDPLDNTVLIYMYVYTYILDSRAGRGIPKMLG